MVAIASMLQGYFQISRTSAETGQIPDIDTFWTLLGNVLDTSSPYS